MLLTDIQITGHEHPLTPGSSVSLNCTTDLAVNTIEWVDNKQNILIKGSNPSLELTITVTDFENLAYTCRTRSHFGIQNKTITLSILQQSNTSHISAEVFAVVVVVPAVLLVFVLCTLVIVR